MEPMGIEVLYELRLGKSPKPETQNPLHRNLNSTQTFKNFYSPKP